jgi:hypothetical protein
MEWMKRKAHWANLKVCIKEVGKVAEDEIF